MFKKHKVVMLPTNNEAIIQSGELFKSVRGFIGLWLKDIKENTYHPECTKQHLYILSDDEIVEGDCAWYCEDVIIWFDPEIYSKEACKKVIATTDPRLNTSVWDDATKAITTGVENGKLPEPDIKGLPRPSKAFIKKYVELQGISEVMVKYVVNPLIDETIVDFEARLERDSAVRYDLVNEFIPKVSKDNTITIKSIEVKNSFNRLEVIAWLDKFSTSGLSLEEFVSKNM